MDTLSAEAFVVPLPDWNSINSVSAAAHAFQLSAIVFFASALFIDLLSMFIQKYHRLMQWIGITIFFLCAGAEFVAYKYDVRREELTEVASQPRRLSFLEKENLRNYLNGQPTGSVLIFADIMAVDASDYANDFASIFRDAGWKVEVKHGLSVPTGDAPSDRGLHIIVREPQPPYPPATVALVNAIHNANVNFVLQYNPSMTDEVQININPK